MSKKKVMVGVVVLILFVLISLGIWYFCLIDTSQDINSNNKEYTGKYENVIVSEEFMINRYFNQIAEIVNSNDISALQAIIDEQDSKYYIMGSRRFI